MHEYDYHIKSLRLFYFDVSKQNPLTHALKDDGSIYKIETIPKHKEDSTKSKKQLLFLVHWIGYETPS